MAGRFGDDDGRTVQREADMERRFKKAIRVIPGVTICLSDAWVSVSAGGRKAKVTPATALMILVLLVFVGFRMTTSR